MTTGNLPNPRKKTTPIKSVNLKKRQEDGDGVGERRDFHVVVKEFRGCIIPSSQQVCTPKRGGREERDRSKMGFRIWRWRSAI